MRRLLCRFLTGHRPRYTPATGQVETVEFGLVEIVGQGRCRCGWVNFVEGTQPPR